MAVALFRSEVRTSQAQALVAKQESLNSIEESLRELMAKKDTLERDLREGRLECDKLKKMSLRSYCFTTQAVDKIGI